jgi:hypothetical protein
MQRLDGVLVENIFRKRKRGDGVVARTLRNLFLNGGRREKDSGGTIAGEKVQVPAGISSYCVHKNRLKDVEKCREMPGGCLSKLSYRSDRLHISAFH